jgi:2-polyprenyl-6-methoxyphenol hydroxylase-like FAD-dependent oxidoreductase
MMADEVTILGGGIGGLTMANALQRVGIPFQLYEQAPELTEVGAGIGMSHGALQLLDMLGLGEEARRRGSPVRSICLADRRLNIRRRLPANYSGLCIHRAQLIDLLKLRLPEERIHLSSRVESVRSAPDRAEIRFVDGNMVPSSCVIAADGINSVPRRSIFPHIDVRWINQTIWRGISPVPLPPPLRDSYVEVWDEGLRFLAVPIGATDTFWLAVKPAPPGERDDPLTVRDDLLGLFRNFHPLFLELIRQSRNFLRDDMGDLGSPAGRPWHHHRVVFIGDAIHATTPNLAQGGCQAMEDAVCLAGCLAGARDDLAGAYRRYQQLREKKVAFVVNTSWGFGVAAHSRNPVRHRMYRALLEYAPAALLARQERFLSDVEYLSHLAGDP